MGELVRRLSGQRLSECLRDRVLAPLGLVNTALERSEEYVARERDRLAWLHVSQAGELRPHPFWATSAAFAICQPGASASGPIEELGRFYEGLLSIARGKGDGILAPETLAAMIARQRTGLMDATFRCRIDWGLGVIVNSNRYGAVPYGFGRVFRNRLSATAARSPRWALPIRPTIWWWPGI